MKLPRFFPNGAASDRPVLLRTRSSTPFILFTIATAIFTDMFLYAVIVPVIPFALSSRAGIDPSEVQHWVAILLAVYAAALLISSPIWGWAADHTESRFMPFTLGLLALIGATVLLCIGNSLAIVIVGRLLQGTSAALVWTVGLAIIVDTVGGEKVGESMGWITLAMGLGIFLGPMLGGIVFEKGGYYAVFSMCFALLGLDCALRIMMVERKVAERYTTAMAVGEGEKAEANGNAENVGRNENGDVEQAVLASGNSLPESQVQNSTPSTELHTTRMPSVFILLKTPRMISALFACLVQAVLLTAFDSTLPLFVARSFGWDSLGAGLIFLAICIPSFSEPGIGWLSDRYGPRYLAAGGFFLTTPFMVLLRFVDHNSLRQKVLLCALLCLIGFTVASTMPPMLAELTGMVAAVERKQPGVFGVKGAYAQAYALFNVAYAAGTLIGPIWGGFLIGRGGLGTVGWSLGLLSALTAVPVYCYAGGEIWKRNQRSTPRSRGGSENQA